MSNFNSENNVYNINEKTNQNENTQSKRPICPDCGMPLFADSGCMCCKMCGFSLCAVA